jgi:hypothetical protein
MTSGMPMKGASNVVRVVVVDDDDLSCETLCLTLVDEGCEVANLCTGAAAAMPTLYQRRDYLEI